MSRPNSPPYSLYPRSTQHTTEYAPNGLTDRRPKPFPIADLSPTTITQLTWLRARPAALSTLLPETLHHLSTLPQETQTNLQPHTEPYTVLALTLPSPSITQSTLPALDLAFAELLCCLLVDRLWAKRPTTPQILPTILKDAGVGLVCPADQAFDVIESIQRLGSKVGFADKHGEKVRCMEEQEMMRRWLRGNGMTWYGTRDLWEADGQRWRTEWEEVKDGPVVVYDSHDGSDQEEERGS